MSKAFMPVAFASQQYKEDMSWLVFGAKPIQLMYKDVYKELTLQQFADPSL